MRELSPGDVIAGKFRLEGIVGRGGMGSVWAARNEQLGMLVALKFIEADDGTDLADARARFEREARAAAQIRSPHVAQILDHGVDGDRPFIAMELLEGEDLGQRLRRERRISVAAMAKILTEASKALRRAHEAGIIHRDLKPGNVFLARFDDDEMVKILDFGVAKVIAAGTIEGPGATQTGMVFGSPTYMSPEQARGVRALDHRTDLWSLAVIAFRAVTGVKPFEASSIGDLVVKLCVDPLPVATSFAPDLPPEIDRFFERAFARDINARFGSAVELAGAFERIAASATAVASAPPPPAPLAHAAIAPAPGSGPHVAFAPGTLTPPPEVATPPPIPPSVPVVATPIAPAPNPSSSGARVVIGSVAGLAALGLVAIVLFAARGERSEAIAPAVSPVAASAIAEPTATAEPAPPPADPAASASAAPPAEPSASASAAAPSAEPSAAPAKPRLPKGGKKRPNFGY